MAGTGRESTRTCLKPFWIASSFLLASMKLASRFSISDTLLGKRKNKWREATPANHLVTELNGEWASRTFGFSATDSIVVRQRMLTCFFMLADAFSKGNPSACWKRLASLGSCFWMSSELKIGLGWEGEVRSALHAISC